MQLSSDIAKKMTYLVGSNYIAAHISDLPPKELFDDLVIDFLNDVARELLENKRARTYSDVVTFGFWIRKASIAKLRERFGGREGLHLGKGVAFHIAPSNVPVNFAYSLVAGLLTGNANVVRVPSKKYPQVEIIIDAINKGLVKHEEIRPYILCTRYDRDKEINDWLSSIADVRVVWGGDQTISELRKSPLPPRSREITFADRYSLAIIDSDFYLKKENKDEVAKNFYNDTFFSDQNACTSPRLIVWMGEKKKEAKEIFWERLHRLVEKKYTFQPIQGINKFVQLCLIAAIQPGIKVEPHNDNLIVRVSVPEVTNHLTNYIGNSGYFYEYDCEDIMKLKPICNDIRCQTIAYIGDKDIVMPLIKAGAKGIDRVVPIGRTMDFDLIWDGYNLPEILSRTIAML